MQAAVLRLRGASLSEDFPLKYPLVAICILGLSVPGRWTWAAPVVDEVAQAVRVEIEHQKIPGLALLVARNGEPIRAEGYGLANVELSVTVKPETLFQSGSVGKQFTATAVMMLVEENSASTIP